VIDVGDFDPVDQEEILEGGTAPHDEIIAPRLRDPHAGEERHGADHIFLHAGGAAYRLRAQDLGARRRLNGGGKVRRGDVDRLQLARHGGETDDDARRLPTPDGDIGDDLRGVADRPDLEAPDAWGDPGEDEPAARIGEGATIGREDGDLRSFKRGVGAGHEHRAGDRPGGEVLGARSDREPDREAEASDETTRGDA